MKLIRNVCLVLLIVVTSCAAADAQTRKADKKLNKENYIKQRISEKRYTFLANYVLPQRGGGKQLTSEYDLRITPDSVISFLPYFGRAYFDVPYNSTEGGIKFTSTKFSYDVKAKKKGGWEITIKPTDAKNIDRLLLNISSDGYASLSVTSSNRDFITYDGYLK